MEENWKLIIGFEDYEISDCGRIKTISREIRYVHAVSNNEHFRKSKSRFLKVYLNNITGYKFVQLYKEKKPYNKTIHRLVAENFIENTSNFDTVNHIDGNKHNNIKTNLEWCTNAYNHKHAIETGLLAKGSKIGTSKLDERCVYAIKRLLAINFSHSLLSEMFLVSRATISLIAEGKSWKHVAITNQEIKI